MRDQADKLKNLLSSGKMLRSVCVWDCFSARAAEMAGFQALMLSGASVSKSLLGIPDLGILSFEELASVADHVAHCTDLPLIVDADEGYGDSPLQVFRNVQKLCEIGVAGFTLDDGMAIRGFDRKKDAGGRPAVQVCDRNRWLAKLEAALDAMRGSNCLLIARTESKEILGFSEAVERCKAAAQLGAPSVMLNHISGLAECRMLAAKSPGWKVYPNIALLPNGQPEVAADEILSLGFNLTTEHYLEKSAIWGMLEYGKQRALTTSPPCKPHGWDEEQIQRIFSMQADKWLVQEERYLSMHADE